MQPPPGPYGQPPGAYGRQNAPNGACCPASSGARRVREGAAAPSSVIREPARGRDVRRRVRFRGRSIGLPRGDARLARASFARYHQRLALTNAVAVSTPPRTSLPRDLTPSPPTPLATRSPSRAPRTMFHRPRSRLSRRGRCSSGRTSATDDADHGASRRRRRGRTGTPRTRDGRTGTRGVGLRTNPGAVPGAASGAASAGGIRSERVRAPDRADGAHGRRRSRAPDRGGDRRTL